MYVDAEQAMDYRRQLESGPGGPGVMLQPDLTRIGRLTGGPQVTLGELGQSDSFLTTEGIFGLPWMDVALIGGVLIGGAFLLKHLGSGGGGGGLLGGSPAPRRRRRSLFKLPKISLPTVALLGAVAYFYAKSQNAV
jgi:hypothetical protein